MRAADPAAKLAELLSRPLVKVCGLTREEDVAAAAEAGADLAGFVRVPASPRAAADVLPVPETMLAVAVWVGRGGCERRGSRPGARPGRGEGARARRGVVPRRCSPSRRTSTSRGVRTTRPTGSAQRQRLVESCSPAGSAPTTSARPSSASDRGRSTPHRAWRRAPGIKDHELVRRYVEEARAA